MAIVSVRGLSATIENEHTVHALRGVIWTSSPEFTVLMGPSSSGKSTLLNLIGDSTSPAGSVRLKAQTWPR